MGSPSISTSTHLIRPLSRWGIQIMSARPIPSREQAVSFSVSPDSVPAAALLYYLNNVTAKDLHARILNTITSQRLLPQDIEKLFVTLGRIGLITNTALTAVGDQTVRHCARCHQTYLEKNNGIQACIIHHDKPRLFKLMKATGANTDRPPYKNYYACCNTLVDVASTIERPHFVGRHTTIAIKVEFNGTNVLPCEQRKCGMAHSNVATPDPSIGGSRPSTATSSRAQSETHR